MSKTELFAQWLGGSLVIEDQSKSTGRRFFVCSVTGTDGAGYGTSPDSPLATLDYAIGLCAADKGDIIYLMPGHAETYSTTGTKVTFDVAGVKIVGIGAGADRPTFSFGHTGAAWVWSAASVMLENVLLVSAVDSIVAPLTISGVDATLRGVEWRDTTDIEFVRGLVTTAAAERLTLEDCFYNGYTGGNACVNAIRLIGVDRAVIRNCRFIGLFSTAAVEMVTTQCTGVVVENCHFLNTGTTLTKDVVDTGGISSTWEATGFDAAGGYRFTGGSGRAVASIDSYTVAALGAGAVDAAAIANDAIDATAIATGAIDADAIAADTILGADNANNAFASTSVVANGDGSLIERLEYLQDYAVAVERAVEKLDGAADTDDLFTITGGPVIVMEFVGLVVTEIGGNAATCQIQEVTTAPAGAANLSTAVNVEGDAVGTSYTFTTAAPSVLTPTTAGALADVPAVKWLCPIGTIKATFSAANVGAIKWYMVYKPLTPLSVVAAAA